MALRFMRICCYLFIFCLGSLGLATNKGIKKNEQAIPGAPLNTSVLPKKILFASCLHQSQEAAILKDMITENADLVIAMGDLVYASSPSDQPIDSAYQKQFSRPDFLKLITRSPLIGIWDDHDYGQNDGGKTNPLKLEAQSAYLKYLKNNAPLIKNPNQGLYHSLEFRGAEKMQSLHIIFLDLRWNRDDLLPNPNKLEPLTKFLKHSDKTKTLLGAEQWSWLEDELKKPATLKVLVSSIQLLPKEHGFEKWDNFPHERQHFLNLINKHQVKNLIILSGDRHMAEVSRMDISHTQKTADTIKLLEITSSSLNRPVPERAEPNPYRISNLYNELNYGVLLLDWEKSKLNFSIQAEKSKTLFTSEFNFSKNQ